MRCSHNAERCTDEEGEAKERANAKWVEERREGEMSRRLGKFFAGKKEIQSDYRAL